MHLWFFKNIILMLEKVCFTQERIHSIYSNLPGFEEATDANYSTKQDNWRKQFKKSLPLRKHIKSLNFFWPYFILKANAFNNIFCFISSNYTLFKSNINFLPDELIIACSLAHIDHSICLILNSVDQHDLLDEGNSHDHGRRKMIQNDSQQHRKTLKPRNNSYNTPNVYQNLLHCVIITYWRTFAIEKITICLSFLFTFFRHEDIQLNHSIFIRLKSILF